MKIEKWKKSNKQTRNYDTKYIRKLLEPRRNSILYVAACISCNLLLKTKNIPETKIDFPAGFLRYQK